MSREHPTVEQNRAHRNDLAWQKSKGRSFEADGERYVSEYVNVFTGQAIRKSWRQTGHDWHVFTADGVRTDRAHSLTWAKHLASKDQP
jgi:hypothetical protein